MQAGSVVASSAPPAHPRPKGRAPTNHSWDAAQGAYVHNETGAEHVKGQRSAASAAQQKDREKDRKRDRGERKQVSGAAHRKDAAVEARRHDANRRRNRLNQHRRAAREKAQLPIAGESFGLIRQREEQRLLVCEVAVPAASNPASCRGRCARRRSGRLVFAAPRGVHVIVRDACAQCGKCLVLESTFLISHHEFEPLDSGSESEPCRAHCTVDHDIMCEL